MDKKTIMDLIETWDADNIKTAMVALKKDKSLEEEICEYYKYALDVIFGSTLKSLVKFPEKLDKKDHFDKFMYIRKLPEGMPSFITILKFNAVRRIDSWRNSHYKKELHIDWFPKNMAALKQVTELHLEYQQYDELPERIGELENLEVLNLLDNNLKSLPKSFENLKKLRILNVRENYSLNEIPDLSKFPNLEEVDFNYTMIDSLPDGFFDLKNLKKIVTLSSPLDKNMDVMRKIFKTFPNAEIHSNAKKAIELEDKSDAGEFAGKEQIKISDWNINKLPAALFLADAVKSLSINCNSLSEIADEFDKLQTVEKLELSVGYDEIDFPASIYKLKKLKELRLKGGFHNLPEGIDALESLEILEIDNNSIKKLPKSFANLKNVKEIELKHVNYDIFSLISDFENLESLVMEYHNYPFEFEKSLSGLTKWRTFKINTCVPIGEALYKLPQNIEKMELKNNVSQFDHKLSLGKIINHFTSLKELDIDEFNLSDVSEAILPNTNLTKLDLDYVKIAHLPDSFSNLQALTNFSMYGDGHESLNASVYECSELKFLRLGKSKFEVIPSGISKLQKLDWLGFEYGNIIQFPEDIYEMKNLKKIAMENCPLLKDKEWKALIKKKIKGIKIVKAWYD
ncbi:leucine-rich repeat domain-containing protein [Flavobacterium qiangtangense]|uniref:Leucine-rich repeat domain-containing protein n=1 Tax=Flavobacterium qiangtangense TaxID=1442595 RepID=A0ABW1PKS0_9FLAO